MGLDEWGIPAVETFEFEEYVEEKPKGVNPFEIMMSALNKKSMPSQREKDSIPEFLFHQILSNDPNTVELALIFTTHDIPVAVQYNFVRYALPKCYIAFPKKDSKVDDKTIINISNYYDCNIRTAERYAEMMPEGEISRINNKFTEGKGK